jgi:hypothetical protein
MSDISPDTIICKFAAVADQWVAHFERRPQFAFGADLPMTAVRRLLEGMETVPDTYQLVCDADRAGSGVLHRDLIWQPPEIRLLIVRRNRAVRRLGGRGMLQSLRRAKGRAGLSRWQRVVISI